VLNNVNEHCALQRGCCDSKSDSKHDNCIAQPSQGQNGRGQGPCLPVSPEPPYTVICMTYTTTELLLNIIYCLVVSIRWIFDVRVWLQIYESLQP
jgi:hypothetical protein